MRWFDPVTAGSRASVTPDSWTDDYYQVDDLRNPDSPVQLMNTVVTEAGNPGI